MTGGGEWPQECGLCRDNVSHYPCTFGLGLTTPPTAEPRPEPSHDEEQR